MPWTAAVRGGCIDSRRKGTDKAIIDALCGLRPRTVIDLGCGEGWLVRALSERDIDALGLDGEPALIAQAQAAGGGRFEVQSYEALAEGALALCADVVVCNFSLLGGAVVERVLRRVPEWLRPQGHLVVQTLHPWLASGEAGYRDGWREGSWAGCGAGFGEAAPWYFRTLGSWLDLLERSGLRLRELREPISTDGHVLSLLLVASVA